MKKILLLLLLLLLTACSNNELNEGMNNIEKDEVEERNELHDITGYYEGNINVNGNPLPLTLNLDHSDKVTGYIDIKVQNIFNLTLEELLLEDNKLSFVIDLTTSTGSFEGEFIGKNYSGTYTQSGQSFPFEFNLSEKEVFDNREALEYSDEDVALKGEYIIPEVQGKMPVVLIINGSGPTDMDGNSSAGAYTNSSLFIAEELEKVGIASLRYNKRILDNKITSELEISFEDFIDDAVNLTEMLKADKRFNEVYIIGHSQGALIAKIVSDRTNVDKVVLLAGAGRTIDLVLIDQLSSQLSEEQLNQAKVILNKLKAGETTSEVPDILISLFRDSIQPFMISWIKYDPQEIIKSIDTEILIVAGGYDLQVAVSEAEILFNNRPDAELLVIDTMNHVLKETTSDRNDNLATYTNGELPIHSELVEALINFFNK